MSGGLPDGSKEVFAQSDGATSYPRRIFMTQMVDPAGNTVAIGYDASFRVTTLTDALEPGYDLLLRAAERSAQDHEGDRPVRPLCHFRIHLPVSSPKSPTRSESSRSLPTRRARIRLIR